MDSGDHIAVNFQTNQPISTDGRTKYNPHDAKSNAGNTDIVQESKSNISNTMRSSNSILYSSYVMLHGRRHSCEMFLCLHQIRPMARPQEPYTPLWLEGSSSSSSHNNGTIHIKLAGHTNIKLSYPQNIVPWAVSLRPMLYSRWFFCPLISAVLKSSHELTPQVLVFLQAVLDKTASTVNGLHRNRTEGVRLESVAAVACFQSSWAQHCVCGYDTVYCIFQHLAFPVGAWASD